MRRFSAKENIKTNKKGTPAGVLTFWVTLYPHIFHMKTDEAH